MKLSSMAILICLLSCKLWTEPGDRKIAFINQSDTIVDSALIGVSSATSYTIKIKNIHPGDSIVSIIPHSAFKSNRHDITVSITIFFKEKPLYEYSYNDLTGYLIHDFTLTLTNNRKLEWKIGI